MVQKGTASAQLLGMEKHSMHWVSIPGGPKLLQELRFTKIRMFQPVALGAGTYSEATSSLISKCSQGWVSIPT